MNDKIKVCVSKDPPGIYLLNPTDEDIQLSAGEIMGFGPGSFKAVTPGWAACREVFILLIPQAPPLRIAVQCKVSLAPRGTSTSLGSLRKIPRWWLW